MVYAAVSDIQTLEIPNALNLALAALFAPAAYLAGFDATQVLVHYGTGLGFLAAGMILFALRVMGGGDVKMMAAIAPWLDGTQVLPFVVYVAVAGGLLALIILVLRKAPAGTAPKRWLPWLDGGENARRQSIPYGVAIAAATLWLLPGLAVLPAP